MFKQQQYIALGAVTLATLILFSLPRDASARLKLAIGGLFLPLFGLAGAAQQLPAAAADALLPRRELLRQIQALRRENEQLEIQAQQAAAVARENDRLRAELGWQKRAPWRMKLAHVVMRDPANWWRTVQIDLGSRDGLRENLPVLTPQGLVGRVASVAYARAQVELLGDPHCRVSARVNDPAHDMGIVVAGGPLDNSLVTLTYVSGGADLKPGEEIFTSGLGGVYPAGIPIGLVVDSRPVEFGLYTEARVKLSPNLGALRDVWVLFP
ncbi:MAG: rod shape-determining protein MreC [Verrucomicrobiota bacterium]|nr:rod shape-determining protein MreC [Verrucomicrobiota bacterium]